MALTLMLITNDLTIAKLSEKYGVDWVFVDLEWIGKEERQGHLDTVRSNHTIEDVRALRAVLKTSKLMVRVNPLHAGSDNEISEVVEAGADIVMLPYFSSSDEVERFVSFVDNRAQICLLVETPGAVDNIEDILRIPGIDFVHIGLNDLHLALKKTFMFEFLSDGTLDRISKVVREAGIPFGFGGIARLGEGALPAENIIPEHYRLGSSMAILSRSFLSVPHGLLDYVSIEKDLRHELSLIRAYERQLNTWQIESFRANGKAVAEKVRSIVWQKSETRHTAPGTVD